MGKQEKIDRLAGEIWKYSSDVWRLVERLDKENKRLQEEIENVTSMIVAIGGAGALQAAREREEGDGQTREDRPACG